MFGYRDHRLFRATNKPAIISNTSWLISLGFQAAMSFSLSLSQLNVLVQNPVFQSFPATLNLVNTQHLQALPPVVDSQVWYPVSYEGKVH